ncbi:MAG: AAA family ATPase [Pseudomonadota bacterium]
MEQIKMTEDHAVSTDNGPDHAICAKEIFGVDLSSSVPAFKNKTAFVPDIDKDYDFDPLTTRSILLGVQHNKRVLIHGPHGTGKSTHIEQVAARLNWPCLRINLDGHLTRSDLIGRDAITLQDGQQVTSFKDGLLTYAIKRPFILVLDEYDAGRPEVMFVIQRLLEDEGKLTIVEKNEIVKPHPFFRIFATSNTIGMGDLTGLYHGTQYINQGQMDRWSLTVSLDYLPPEKEAHIILSKTPELNTKEGIETIKQIVNLASMIRSAFKADEIMNVISLRALINWAQNIVLYDDIALAFCVSYLNRQDQTDQDKIKEFYQRCFGEDIMLKSAA